MYDTDMFVVLQDMFRMEARECICSQCGQPVSLPTMFTMWHGLAFAGRQDEPLCDRCQGDEDNTATVEERAIIGRILSLEKKLEEVDRLHKGVSILIDLSEAKIQFEQLKLKDLRAFEKEYWEV